MSGPLLRPRSDDHGAAALDMQDPLSQPHGQGVRSDLDLDLAARHCQAMMYGLQVQWLFDPGTDMVTSFQGFLDGYAK